MVGATAGPLPPPTHDADAGANAVYQYLTEAEVGRMNHSFNHDPGVVGQMGGSSRPVAEEPSHSAPGCQHGRKHGHDTDHRRP